jgi:hypothetical protein
VQGLAVKMDSKLGARIRRKRMTPEMVHVISYLPRQRDITALRMELGDGSTLVRLWIQAVAMATSTAKTSSSLRRSGSAVDAKRAGQLAKYLVVVGRLFGWQCVVKDRSPVFVTDIMVSRMFVESSSSTKRWLHSHNKVTQHACQSEITELMA